MTREEAKEMIVNYVIYTGDFNSALPKCVSEALDRLLEPPTLAELLGKEEGVEYVLDKKDVFGREIFKINANDILIKNEHGDFCKLQTMFSAELIYNLRSAKPVDLQKEKEEFIEWLLEIEDNLKRFDDRKYKYINRGETKGPLMLIKKIKDKLGITE